MERAADLANIRSIGTAKTVLIRTITNQIFLSIEFNLHGESEQLDVHLRLAKDDWA